jgi:calcineurin-like phosphoesterase family protein
MVEKMAIYFTADLHLHHKNIIRYAHRNPPFGNTAEMDSGLTKCWNSVVKKHDTVYHLGDFCLTRKRNTKDAVNIYSDTMRRFHGRKVFLRGNHDKGLQNANYFLYKRIGGIKVFMRHWPPWQHPTRFPHSFSIPFDVDLILCGHVHDKWKYHVHRVGKRRIPVINVGTDVWGYKPVNLRTIVKEIARLEV